MKEKLYEVTVEVSFTKRYYIHAPTEEKARDTYFMEGFTSKLYETDEDRTIIQVAETELKKTGN
jgi:hypothetical protein|tara:strand:- start:8682 stop:8873 length:192 start_codon:yes stop_codon:yes gene_type:complete